MLRKSIITSLVLSCITASGHAIDINLPGDDRSIPNNTYENSIYMTPTMEDAFNRSVVKSVETLTTKDVVKDITHADSVSDAELKAFKFKSYILAHQQFDTSTVTNIHNQEGGLSVTVPVAALRNEKVDVGPKFKVSYIAESPMATIKSTLCSL
ncbi:hypothetical protein [Veillonella caviae]|uniref:hypothetical protein n=1 Tax=Veillonella caviae TaxID=248316 RepID=UPI002A916860|nr:hypothetical protein [Veillonella caviae]MDY5253053.1 hypothetical protein [Veillonella caviae]